MSKKLNETPAFKLAGLTADLMNKLRNEVITAPELEKFLTLSSTDRAKLFGTPIAVEAILKNISGSDVLKLDAGSGTKTIADSKNIFSWIDDDFKAYGANTKGVATKETSVDVYEMAKDATFAQMFGSLSTDLSTLCLTQEQILNFVAKHRNMLRTEGYGTFFLFKSGEDFFVARVYVCSDGLRVYVRRFEYGRVWSAERSPRLVVPQLTA